MFFSAGEAVGELNIDLNYNPWTMAAYGMWLMVHTDNRIHVYEMDGVIRKAIL